MALLHVDSESVLNSLSSLTRLAADLNGCVSALQAGIGDLSKMKDCSAFREASRALRRQIIAIRHLSARIEQLRGGALEALNILQDCERRLIALGEDIGTGPEHSAHGAQQRRPAPAAPVLPPIRCITVSDDRLRFTERFIPDWLRIAARAYFS